MKEQESTRFYEDFTLIKAFTGKWNIQKQENLYHLNPLENQKCIIYVGGPVAEILGTDK